MGARTRWPLIAAALAMLSGAVVMYGVQQQFLVTSWVSSVPAGVVAGLITGWFRYEDPVARRAVVALICSVASVVLVALTLITSMPTEYAFQLVLGWIVVVLELTVVHLAVSAVTALLRRRTPGVDPVARLR